MAISDIPRTLWWDTTDDGRPAVFLVDQTRLPLQGDVLACNTYEGVCIAIATLALRGAPALGVAAAFAIALWSETEGTQYDMVDEYLVRLEEVALDVISTRPTAANLFWGAERMRQVARMVESEDVPVVRQAVLAKALEIAEEDEARNRRIGANGAELLAEGARVLTHCNAGSLATAFFGTALGVVYTAFEQGKLAHVWVDETRPVNQGGRLTAWELGVAGVPHTLIADDMAASVIAGGQVDAIIVGADRIAANGDTANKIGTLGLAVLAKHFGIPFYVAAPTSTVDLTISTGAEIVIEERHPREVEGVSFSAALSPEGEAIAAFEALTEDGPYVIPSPRGHELQLSRSSSGFTLDGWAKTTPTGVHVYNPAFDVTPGELITAIITESGVIFPDPDFEMPLAVMCMGSGGLHELSATAEYGIAAMPSQFAGMTPEGPVLVEPGTGESAAD